MKVFQYWAARTGIFLVVLGILWAVGWFDVMSFIAAFILGLLISYLLLPRMRQAAGLQMATWLERPTRSHHRDDAIEDAEAQQLSQPQSDDK